MGNYPIFSYHVIFVFLANIFFANISSYKVCIKSKYYKINSKSQVREKFCGITVYTGFHLNVGKTFVAYLY